MHDYFSTEVRQEEIEHSVTDKQGNRYTPDFRKLFKGIDCANVEIHPCCSVICNGAFKNCRNIQSIVIPDSVTVIGSYSFAGCVMLKSISIPDSVSQMGIHAFDGCSGLESAVLSCNTSFLPHCAFFRCSSLTTVTIPEGVTIIGKGAFCDCTALKSIHLPNTLVGLWHDVFYGSSLEDINLPDSICLNPGSFNGCFSLRRIRLSQEAYERLGASVFPKWIHVEIVR